jgi:hypothetical protein
VVGSAEALFVSEGVGVDEVGIALAEFVEFLEVIGVVVADEVLFELAVGVFYVLPDDELIDGVSDSPVLFEVGLAEIGLVIAHIYFVNKIR